MKYTFKKIEVALLTLAITSLTGCGAKNAAQDTQAPNSTESVVYRTVDEIKESGTINIGVFSDKSPFGYVEEYGEYHGYDKKTGAFLISSRATGIIAFHSEMSYIGAATTQSRRMHLAISICPGEQHSTTTHDGFIRSICSVQCIHLLS